MEKWVKQKALTPIALAGTSPKSDEPPSDVGEAGRWSYRLTTAKKKEILLNNIHGVDIDAQAVEVTKLSLLLKVLENASGQLGLGIERVLPKRVTAGEEPDLLCRIQVEQPPTVSTEAHTVTLAVNVGGRRPSEKCAKCA